MTSRKSFLLRIPPDLHAELERWAKDELRSLNAQIEFLLRQAVKSRKSHAHKDPPPPGPPPPDDQPAKA